MRNTVHLPEDISRRIDSLVERSNLSRDQIVEDALAQGRSLAWQEQWVAGVLEGLAEAERGEFASEAEIEAVSRAWPEQL
ncbi:MAG: ribbon-helix-helix protein, CopG family [Rhizobium sp.]|nr:ribbon-helix-helix protein, CopG family [Rhizobium sp.]MCZ8348568.1 ribbon-helix-helix protein, CopG family [Rhizobium sp.]